MQDLAEQRAKTENIQSETAARSLLQQGYALDNQRKAQDVQSQKDQAAAQQRLSDAMMPPPSLQQQGQAQQPAQQPTDEAATQQQLAQQKQQAARKVREQGDPATAEILDAQAEKHLESYYKLTKAKDEITNSIAQHHAQIFNQIHDQASLDTAIGQLNARHDGMADDVNFPKVWDAVHSPAYFQQRVQSAFTVSEQLKQQQDIATAADTRRETKAKADKAESEAAMARIESARLQAGLSKLPPAAADPSVIQAKADAKATAAAEKNSAAKAHEIELETNRYNKEKENAPSDRVVLKAPTTTIDAPLGDKLEALMPGNPALPTKREQALKDKLAAIEVTHGKNLAAIETQFGGGKTPVGNAGKPETPQTKADFYKLPKGARFINPADGKIMVKK